jgi:hypothetical protein
LQPASNTRINKATALSFILPKPATGAKIGASSPTLEDALRSTGWLRSLSKRRGGLPPVDRSEQALFRRRLKRGYPDPKETLVQQPGLDSRHRDKNGEISRKHGNTLIRTLRQTYGPGFATECDPNAKLSDCLHQIDDRSLSQLVRDTVG